MLSSLWGIEIIKLHLYWILYWLLTSKYAVSNVTSLPPLGQSDHIVIMQLWIFVLLLYWLYQCAQILSYMDVEIMNPWHTNLLNIDWAHLFEGQDMNVMWLWFHAKLLNLIDKYNPVETFNFKPKPKWLNLFKLKKIKSKHKTWNSYLQDHQTSSGLYFLC